MGALKSVKWYEGGVVLEETAVPPIPPKHVLAKVLSVLIYSPHKNKNVFRNTVPGRTLGGFGLVRVIEPGVGAEVMPGEVFFVKPYTTHGILGLDIDGLASEYAVIPREALVSLKGAELERISSLHVEFGYIHELVKLMKISERGLIVGCGLAAYILGLAARDYRNVEILCSNTDYLKSLRDLGLSLKRGLEDLKDRVDLLILTEEADIDLKNVLRENAWIYVAPGVFTLSLHYRGIPSKIMLARPKTFKPEYSMRFLGRVSPHILESQVKTVSELSQAVEALSLFERVIIDFK